MRENDINNNMSWKVNFGQTKYVTGMILVKQTFHDKSEI